MVYKYENRIQDKGNVAAVMDGLGYCTALFISDGGSLCFVEKLAVSLQAHIFCLAIYL